MELILSVVEWLNCNEGFAIFAVTLVSTSSAFVMAFLMKRSNTIAAKNLKQALDIEKEKSRPYVIFDIEFRNSFMYATLKNMGLTPAMNVCVEILPDLVSEAGDKTRRSSLIEHGCSFLAPGREIADFISAGHKFFVRFQDPTFRGEVKYEDSTGKKFSEKFQINLNVYGSLVYLKPKEAANEIEKLTQEIQQLRKIFMVLLRKFGKDGIDQDS